MADAEGGRIIVMLFEYLIKLERVEPVVRTIPFSLKAGEELETITWTAEAPELVQVQLYDNQGRILLDQISSGADC